MYQSASEPALQANYGGGLRKVKRKQKAVVRCKQECDWVDGTHVREHEIPDYNAEVDGHCKYVAKPMGVPRIPAEILRRAAAGGSANPFKGAMPKAKPAGSQADRAAQKLELNCLKCILIREGYLTRLTDLANRLQNGESGLLKSTDGSGLLDLLMQTRNVTIETVETIARFQQASAMQTFTWNGTNYLLKLTSDLNFLADIYALVQALQIPREKMLFNPFMLANTLHEAYNEPEQEDYPPGQEQVRRVERVVLDEIERCEATGELDDAAEQDIGGGIGQDITQYEDEIDPVAAQHTHAMEQWHKQAKKQLRSLQEPMLAGNPQRFSTNRLHVPKRGGPLLQPLPESPSRTLNDVMLEGNIPDEDEDDSGIYAALGVSPAALPLSYLPPMDHDEQFLRARKNRGKSAAKKPKKTYIFSEPSTAARYMLPKKEASETTVGEEGVAPKKKKIKKVKSAPKASRALSEAVADLTAAELQELAQMDQPPQAIALVAATVLILLAPGEEVPADLTWSAVNIELSKGRRLLRMLKYFDPSRIVQFKMRALQPFISNPNFNEAALRELSIPASKLVAWVLAVVGSRPEYMDWLMERENEQVQDAAAADEGEEEEEGEEEDDDEAAGPVQRAMPAAEPPTNKPKPVRKNSKQSGKHATSVPRVPKNVPLGELLFTDSKSIGRDAAIWTVTIFEVKANKQKVLVKAYDPFTSKELRLIVDLAKAGMGAYTKKRLGKAIMNNIKIAGLTPDKFSLEMRPESLAARQGVAAAQAQENSAATLLQNKQRQKVAIQVVEERKGAVVLIQNKSRQRQAKKVVEERKGAVVLLQSKTRQKLAKQKVAVVKVERKEQDQAATMLQTQSRRKHAKKKVAERKGAVVMIQNKQRQRLAKAHVQERKGQKMAVTKIQSRHRQRQAARRVQTVREEKTASGSVKVVTETVTEADGSTVVTETATETATDAEGNTTVTETVTETETVEVDGGGDLTTTGTDLNMTAGSAYSADFDESYGEGSFMQETAKETTVETAEETETAANSGDEASAVTRIQSRQRQRQAGRRVGEMKQQKGAATAIQSKHRQRKARMEVGALQAELTEQKQAAVVIQTRARQRKARKHVLGKKQAQLIAGNDDEEDDDYGDDDYGDDSFEMSKSRPGTAAYDDEFDNDGDEDQA
jgi:hypothetical protein